MIGPVQQKACFINALVAVLVSACLVLLSDSAWAFSIALILALVVFPSQLLLSGIINNINLLEALRVRKQRSDSGAH